MKKNSFTLFFLIIAVFAQIYAQIPSGFYNTVNGTKGKGLQIALNEIIRNHRSVSYADVWIYYQYTDLKSNGKIWDIYSDNPNGESAAFDFRTDQCVNISSEEGVCYTREHSFCQSWFGAGQAAPYTDIFHLYPVDGLINTIRNNNPYGVVATPTRIFANGSKMGVNTYSGAPSVSCYEPIDAYKGDIARSLLYMAVRYMFEDENFQENSPMTFKSQLQPWALRMLLEWHQLDPVSDKELDRNDAIYAVQKNRNPFIDHPEWIAKIWGSDSINPVQVTLQPPPEKPNIKWFALTDNRTLKITFSQPMVAWTTENPLNYHINDAVSVTSLEYLNDTLTLHIGGLFSENAKYNLSIKHLLAKNMAFVNDTTLSFLYPYKIEQKPLLSWTFDNLQKKPNTPKVIPADYHLLDTVSEAVLYADGTYQSSIWVCNEGSGTELDALNGTTTGDPRQPSKAGMAIAFSNTTSNGKSVVFKFPTKGFFNLALSMAVRRTATGFDLHQWEWSIDGENYTLIEGTTTCPITTGEFVLTTLDLRTIEEIDNREVVFLRLTFFGSTGTTGNNRIDNITIHGVSINTYNINSFEKKNRIIISPNPTTGELRIENGELRIENVDIFDIYGRKHQLITSSSHHLINIVSLPAGIYFLRVDGQTVKVIKN